jgi:hypothetical protein
VITWITDMGFDGIAVWRSVWEQEEHLLCRLKHAERLVEYQERRGGWVAAGFLYELGVTLEWEEVRLLAHLGGWIPRPNNKPGKTVLTRGLRRLLDMLLTQALLEHYQSEHGDLPPRISALLRSGEL